MDEEYNLQKILSATDVYVVGGNHSYMAVELLHKNFPLKKDWFKTVNVSVWWWPALNTNALRDIELLGTRHNVDNELRNN